MFYSVSLLHQQNNANDQRIYIYIYIIRMINKVVPKD